MIGITKEELRVIQTHFGRESECNSEIHVELLSSTITTLVQATRVSHPLSN
jgi:hypothetical protein